MKESIFAGLGMAPAHGESSIATLAHHYVGSGLQVRKFVGCDPGMKTVEVLSMADLSPGLRRESSRELVGSWPLEYTLYDPEDARTRVVRFAPSSIPCVWHEHAAEIEFGVRGGDSGEKAAKKVRAVVLAELKRICSELPVDWAIVSALGRGPSVPELRLRARPAYVHLSEAFLSSSIVTADEVGRIQEYGELSVWERGWFISLSKILVEKENGRSSEGESLLWKLLVAAVSKGSSRQ